MQRDARKSQRRDRRRSRIRSRLSGTAAKPRVSVYKSLKHIYAQAIDDEKGQTLAHASSLEKGGGGKSGGNLAGARTVGSLIAERLKEKGLEEVVFDRGGYPYHGRIKAVADAAREKGLKF
ncbi:MAG TPA: 50S ribosomal protein L18 [Candidatus Polarisedimenticolia bacterium]|jgi:large subunit ribosomal protein L18|nr:50S ribosomal protein L18 [Candidatus Polarisedimenticolia bacterium]